ncbi:NAD(P)/FAD-dependent oxidoreductase [Nocardia sp. NPDC051756]|uniref:flavin-containing monooxygenase n=1 Tax=Nocardia sp. NPDC051756 TaxID=3154751 RepID=UPI003421C4C8
MTRTTTNDAKNKQSRNGNVSAFGGRPEHEVVIIGAGACGIAVGIKLRQAGVEDFVILDRAETPGGTWRDHRYPGVGVDVPILMYEFSFARNKEWTRLFPKGPEINAYHNRIAREFGLDPHFRFKTEVVRQVWDDANHMWLVHTADGRVITTRFLITAVGQFPQTKLPDIPGVTDFQGKTQMSAHWDWSFDHTGLRVAIIGTGASAVQIVPTVAPQVGNLEVFQRTPIYVGPRPDFPIPSWLGSLLASRAVGRATHLGVTAAGDLAVRAVTSTPPQVVRPVMRALDYVVRQAFRGWIRVTVRDREVRAALLPGHGVVGKRPTVSNSYLQAFNRDNVRLITTPIERVTANGILTNDGVEHAIDMLVLATGHELFTDPEYYRPGTILGRNGFDLGAFYAEHGVQAYESMAVPGLPNRWMLSGPYSWSVSLHSMAELLATTVVRVITAAHKRGDTLVEVEPAIHRAYHEKQLERARNVEWYFHTLNKGLKTYYINSQGRMAALRYSSWATTMLKNRRSPLAAYTCERLEAQRPAGARVG